MVDEGDILSSHPYEITDDEDSKYLFRLSTILVATIQELKDRVSQIEFIFCNQLFPRIKSRSKNLEKRLVDARKSAEEEWKNKESSYLSQIEALRSEKKKAEEHISLLNDSLEKSKARLSSTESLLNKSDCEKQQLLGKLEFLQSKEEIVSEIKEQLGQKRVEIAEEKKLQAKLVEQIEVKDQQLLAEQRKRRSLYEDYSAKYKKLKSDYIFLVKKAGLATENKPSQSTKVEEKSFLCNSSFEEPEHQLCSKSTPEAPSLLLKLENGERDSNLSSKNVPSSISKFSGAHRLPPKYPTSIVKDIPPGPGPSWRNTRAPQSSSNAATVADPHDNFLDTPMENVVNLQTHPRDKVAVEEEKALDLPDPGPKDMDFNNSDEETQLEQQGSTARRESKSFKYVETVRKKADRESLRGLECKQCKKFYDAVLAGGDDDHSEQMRCEHHEGVSRHRYRYAPPMTPEGFWNIGFDSDL